MADRYWVGGTAAWDGTAGTKWATTSGGAGGASVPTSADDVFFTNLSTGTCTISTGNTGAKSINCTGFTGTLAGTAAITVSGSITLVAGMGFTYSGTTIFNGAGTLTSAGKTFSGRISIQITSGTLTLGDAFTTSTGITVFQGGFNTSSYNVTSPEISSSNTNTRTISFGSSTVTLSTGANAVDFGVNTNLTFNAGTSTIVCTGSGCTLRGGAVTNTGVTFYNVSFTSTTVGSNRTIESINTFNNLTITGPSTTGVVQVTFDSRQTINGTLSTTGTAGNRRVWFRGVTYGLAQTLTVNATPSLTDADFRDIYVIGTAAPISGTRVGDLRGCRGITFDTPKSVYWVTAAGGNWSGNNWAASSGGAVSTDNFPLAQDTAVIENTGLNTSATVTMDNVITNTGTVDMSSRTNAMTLSVGAFTIYGDWKNGSGTTLTASGTLTFSGRNTQTITSAGKTFSGPVTVDTYGGSVELADSFVCNFTLTITNGTFDTKNYNITPIALSSSNSNVRTIKLGSSTVSLNNNFSFSNAVNLTFDAGTSSITFVNVTGSLPSTGLAFYNFTYNSGTLFSLSGGNHTFNNLTITAPASAGLVGFSLSGNSTITGTLTVAGATAVRRIFVRSDTLGTTRTLTVGTLSADNCDFRDITITGTAAGSSPTRAGDCGGNSGITFPSPKTVYWNLAGSQNWSATAWASSSGGTPDINQFPLAQDTAVFDNTGSAGTVTIDQAWNIGTFDASARTSAMTFSTGTNIPFVYGDWKFGTGVTSSSTTGTITFAKRGTQTITSNGITFGCPIIIDAVVGTVQLADALTIASNRIITLASGTFDAVSYNVTLGGFASTAGSRTLKMGSGTWTCSGTNNLASGSVFLISNITTFNFYKGTANIVLSDTSTTDRTFAGSGLSYNKLTIGGTTGTSTLTITGNNQFTELASTKTVAHTIALDSTAQTFGKWTVTGTAGNVVTLTGTGTSHVLAGAATSGIDYLAMGSIGFAATSPGEFYAGANSTGTAAAPVYRTAPPTPRTLYWVGGTGNWSDTARWSTSSGGASGAAVPTSLDDVVFDSLSNATAYTSTVNATSRCNKLTIAGPASGNVTLAGTSALIIHDDVTLPATGLTRTYTGAITLSGSTSGKVLTTNGVALASGIEINGVNCEWTLGSALNNGSSIIGLRNGSLLLDTYNLTAGSLVSDYGHSRTINFGSGTVALSASTPINFGTTETNRSALTSVAGTGQINLSTGSPTINGNNQTFYNVAFTSTTSGTVTINGANSFNSLSFTGITSAGLKIISVTANQTITGTFTCSAGTDATMRHFVRSDTIGTTRTITAAAVSLTDVDFRDITIAGAAAPATGTRLGDCKGNSGITFTAAANKYWNLAGGGNWSATGWATSSGGTPAINNFPLAQDTCFFEATGLNSGASIIMNADYNVGTVDMSARTTNTISFLTSNRTISVYGNWINGTGTAVSNNGLLFFAGRGSQTLTSAGVSFASRLEVNSPGGTLTLQDAYQASNTNTGAITLTSGTLNAVTYNVTLGSGGTFLVSGTATRTVAIGSGTWTSSGIGSAWDAATITNLTITGTGTISLTSASAKTFAGGSVSYSGITLNQGGAGTLAISGNNTFANITNTYKATGATTINFGTTTQRVGNFTAAGEAGRALTLTGSSASSPATLVLTSGTVTTPDYLTITGIRAYSLTTTWYAGANSTNNGSLGWYFEAAGGTVYNVFFSDTAIGADSVQAGLVFSVAFSDTATGVDSILSGLAFSASFSDTATGADAVSASFAFNVSFSDSATGEDSVAVAASVFGSAFSDTATGADALSASATLNVSLSDTATGTDVFSTQATFGAAFSDTATGADTVATSAALGLSFSDTATGTDSLIAGLTFSAAFSDTVSGADVFAVAASTFNTSFLDTAAGTDAVSVSVTFGAAFSDTATGTDAPAVAASTFNASILDAAQALDTPTAGGTFNVSFSDAGAITDLVAGGYLWNPIDDSQTPNWQNVLTASPTTWAEVNDTQSPGWVQINDAPSSTWVDIDDTQSPGWGEIQT